MILARKAILLAPVLLAGCFSLPQPAPATARSQVGDPAPVTSLARTAALAAGAHGGVVSLRELWGETSLVLVFYRGSW